MIEYRQLRPEDIARVQDIEKRAFVDPWPDEAFSIIGPNHNYTVFKDGLLIGYVICITALDESSIANIAIDPDYQLKGYGSGLMDYTLQQLRKEGVSKIFLDVRRSNLAAQNLYTKFGFRHLGIRKDYYHSPPEDALVMILEMESL